MMKRQLKICICVFALLFVFYAPGVVFADAGISSPDTLIDTGDVDLELEKSEFYVFDKNPDLGFLEQDFDTIIANFLFGIMKALVSITCFIVTLAYTMDLTPIFEPIINNIMGPLELIVFDNFFPLWGF